MSVATDMIASIYVKAKPSRAVRLPRLPHIQKVSFNDPQHEEDQPMQETERSDGTALSSSVPFLSVLSASAPGDFPAR